MADMLLLAAVVGSFVVIRSMQGHALAERVLVWGLALLVLASVVMVARQVADPDLAPVLASRMSTLPTGFFGHYNYGANFLIGSSCLVGGAALFGRYSKAERAIWGVIAVAGMVAVYFTRSRGGICGAASALGVFAVLALIIGKRRGARWFAPGIVALPLIGCVVVGFLFQGWSDAQEARKQAAGLDVMLDNTFRLHLIGIAVECIGQHPWEGGGSRSFSWECYRFWDWDMHGPGETRPEQVHNEILQAATDYGITGAGLLGLFIGSLGVIAVIRMLFAEASGKPSNEDAWRLGGLAGLAGMLVQSNFCFVLHVVPNALLLGICLARTAHTGEAGKPTGARSLVPGVVAAGCGLACAALLLPLGWTGSRVVAVRWADSYGTPPELSPESRIAALTAAIRWWPLQKVFQERARIYQQQAAASAPGSIDEAAVKHALDDYREASLLNPFDPDPVVNRANLLGLVGREAAALEEYDRAIRLQGGMEAGFKAAYSKAAYLQLKAERLLSERSDGEAMAALWSARDTLVNSCRFPSGAPLGQVARVLRAGIAGRLGVLLSLAGRDREAEAEFENAAVMGEGTGIRYFHAWHLRVRAERIWNERKPAEALGLFLKARSLIDRTGPTLPAGVTTEDQAKLRKELDSFIQFLKGAKIEAAELPGK
ncbi:MAG: O-antigen ligase family protein [Verrucomicrobia bacterium]|nr:O-antigen ligase family protein [Verrucomicrobiota bacterium]